ncbi:MAG: transposase [Clostridia bacterium]|nr:transposase [Clostridia bacterium]
MSKGVVVVKEVIQLGRDNILRDIFFDENRHWGKFVSKYKKRIRPIVLKEIDKFRRCGQKEAGFTLFACPVCGEMKIVPHTCKGRFCTSCSTGYTQEWSRETSQRIYSVPHRHIMFTVDERLWEIFTRHRELLKDLMDLAVNILLDWLKKRDKVKSGAMVGIHTFGAKMNFNPHVHILVTEGGFDGAGKWVVKDFIPYKMLRKRWQATVMAMLKKKLPEQEVKRHRNLFQKIWDDNPEGFVIYGPPNKKGNGTVEAQVGYIGRYMRRPAMALSRILEYDGEKVTFKYFDKTEQKEKQETIFVEEFISRIIRHIPDEQFKTIRYYGIYSRRGKGLADKLMEAWLASQRRKRRKEGQRKK